MQGIIDRLQREQERGVIRGDDGREFWFEPSAIDAPFDSLKLGTRVDFQVIDTTSSGELQAVKVHARGELKPVAADSVEPEKAAKPDVEAVISQTPPEAVERSEVDEASWESFPASDPPAKHETT